MTDSAASAQRAEPGRLTRWGVLAGFAKVDLEDLWWVDQVTQDPTWMRRAALLRVVPQLLVYGAMAVVVDRWGFFIGALLGIGGIILFGREWIERRTARGIRNLHGIGDKRSFWADWPASLYLGFNVAALVGLVGVAVLVVGWIGDRDEERSVAYFATPVRCVAAGNRLEMETTVVNPSDAPQRVIVDFSYVEAFGGDAVIVPTRATLTPGGRQEVVAFDDVGPSQGCFGVTASVRSAP